MRQSNLERALRVIAQELDEMGIGNDDRDVSGGDAVEYLNELRERIADILGAQQ